MAQDRPESRETVGIQFILWVWPTVYAMFTSMFNPGFTTLGWTALGAGLFLYQGHRWLSLHPSMAPRWNPWTIGLVIFLFGTFAVPWQRFGIHPLFIHISFLFLLAIILRALQIGILNDGVSRPGFLRAFIPVTIAGELVYITAWLYVAWSFSPVRHVAADPHSFWARTPYPLIGLILTLHFIYLQMLLHINPRHLDGAAWLRESATAVTLGIIFVPLALIPFYHLNRVWWLLFILTLYAYRSLIYTRETLQSLRKAEEERTPPFTSWSVIRLRWFRQALFYSLTLLALLYLYLQDRG